MIQGRTPLILLRLIDLLVLQWPGGKSGSGGCVGSRFGKISNLTTELNSVGGHSSTNAIVPQGESVVCWNDSKMTLYQRSSRRRFTPSTVKMLRQ